jgi:hypothetical protein
MQWLRRHLAAEAAAGHKQAVMWILRMIGLGEGRHYTEPQLHHAAKKMIEEAKEIT